MDLFAILATCAVLSGATPNSETPISTTNCEAAAAEYQTNLQSVELNKDDREAIARVAFAEAANQGDSGLAGVVYTIINRLISGQWGDTVTAVVNAPRQFEPVHYAGGWRKLPAVSSTQQTRIDTIINLVLEGRLPDLTNGALFFQNPEVMAQREAAGQVSKGLTHFGGSTPSAVIQDHTFYASINSGGSGQQATPFRLQAERRPEARAWDIYGQAQDRKQTKKQSWDVFANGGTGKTVIINVKENK